MSSDPVLRRAQIQLEAKGYKPGPIDGIFGRRTAAALRAYQKDQGLLITSVFDGPTAKALLGEAPATPPWIAEITRRMGLHEVRDNGVLRKWLKSDGRTLGDPAKLPWCGDAVETPLLLTLPNEVMPTNPYLAANWVKFGIACKPQLGAIMSFWRGSPTSWQGHVGFYVGETATHYVIRGGNQTNMIKDSRIAKERLRDNGSRWPKTYLAPAGGSRLVDGSAYAETVNEA